MHVDWDPPYLSNKNKKALLSIPEEHLARRIYLYFTASKIVDYC